MFRLRALASFLALIFASPALAHTGEGAGGFLAGLAHPVFGPDHVAAMVAVGLWGAFLGVPAIWLLPIVFPLVMAAGGVLGILGVPLPAVEAGIAASAIVLGLMIVLAPRPGRIGAEITIPFAYPRPPELAYTSEFAEITGQVARALREVSR